MGTCIVVAGTSATSATTARATKNNCALFAQGGCVRRGRASEAKASGSVKKIKEYVPPFGYNTVKKTKCLVGVQYFTVMILYCTV